MEQLRGYQATIADAIGSANPFVLDQVEQFMREEVGTLDALDRSAFFRVARRAKRNFDILVMAGDIDPIKQEWVR